MANVEFALQAKSDQLNAVDIMAEPRIIKIRDVKVSKGEQPVSIYFDGDNNRPWKPSKGMLRIVAGAWGQESSNWVGKYAKLFFEPSVIYGGKEVGGIRVSELSDIDPKGMRFALTLSKTKREPYVVKLLAPQKLPPYPEDKFNNAFDAMVSKMQSGEMTLQHIISQCQKTGELSEEQIKRLETAAPVEVEE